jgi:hypothetical protein
MPDKTKGDVKSVDVKGTKEEGIMWVSSTGSVYVEPEVTVEALQELRDNIYGRGVSIKLRNLVFRDKYTIEVLDPKGDPNEDLAKIMTTMCDAKSVRLWANMQRAFIDTVWEGIGLFNPVWAYEEAEYKIMKLRHLPAHTFGEVWKDGDQKVYCSILKGISVDKKGEVIFVQTDGDGNQKQIKNIFYVKDPVADGPGGESLILPIVPFIEMLKYVLNTQMQQANRTGAKILFIRVTAPQPPSPANGGVGDIEYANILLEKWGKDQGFQLRENMEIVDPHIKDDANNLEIKEALEAAIIDYIVPTAFISKKGSGLGGSEASRDELLNKFIEGIQSWVADQFEMLLSDYLEYNKYVDYRVHVKIPTPSIDRSDIKIKEADVGFKTHSLFKNEIRERLNGDNLDEESLKRLEEEYRVSTPEPEGKDTDKKKTEDGKKDPGAMETADQGVRDPGTVEEVEKTTEELLEEAAERLTDNLIKHIGDEEE